MKNKIKIAIIGGSGFWSEQSHHKHILELKPNLPVELKAIIDPVEPRSVIAHKNMQKLIALDKTVWLNPKNFKRVDEIIKNLADVYKIDLVIIASNPCTHFEYGLSCIKHGLNVICDKPIVSSYNSSINPQSAAGIMQQYNELLKEYNLAKRSNPNLLYHSVLRRRSLDSFIKVADELNKVYKNTGAGINNMTVLINGGIYKLPAELTTPGAHGYLDGVGSLTHSAYHYIDVIAWFLSQAPGNTISIVPKLDYVLRVKDYINSRTYKHIANLLKSSKTSLSTSQINETVLGCELDSGFTFIMQDKNNVPVGEITFLFNHISFSPRTKPYDRNISEPPNHLGGGRMSHCFIDVHQEGLQNWQIIKNDIVFEENKIILQGRRHPLIEGDNFESHIYNNAYEPEISLKDLLKHVIKNLIEDKSIEGHFVIRGLQDERLATEIYSACYELIANEYIGLNSFEPHKIRI